MDDWTSVALDAKAEPTEHAACILAIVGSRDVHVKAAQILVGDALKRHQPIVVVSGGAKVRASDRFRGLVSIDEVAAVMARAAGIQVAEFIPTNFHWNGAGGFRERNQKIADTCMCLVRIASTTTKTYGSGWTADYAEQTGKNVERFVVDEKGAIRG